MYEIQGIICSPAVADAQALPCCRLTDSLALVPFKDLFLERTGIAPLALSNSEDPEPLHRFLRDSSTLGSILYVEAEFWGGIGEQTSWVWRDGQPLTEPEHSKFAINSGLAQLGVQPHGTADQFEVVGLDQYRRTEEWPTAPAALGANGG
jgi:hypothetical protein